MPLLCNSHQRAWPQTGTRCWLSVSSSPPVVQHSSLFTLLTSLSSLGVHFAPLSLSLLTAWLMLSWLGLNQSVASSCHPVHRGGRSNLTLIKHPNHANVIKKKNALHRKHKPLSLMSCSLLILGSLFIIPQNSISMKFLGLLGCFCYITFVRLNPSSWPFWCTMVKHLNFLTVTLSLKDSTRYQCKNDCDQKSINFVSTCHWF